MSLSGKVIWFTGISGAGKSTLANAVYKKLQEKSDLKVIILDGDIVREFFEGDLGYSRADRISNIKRITFAASLLASVGVTVLVANIAPYIEVRDFVRRKLGDSYRQIYLKATLDRVSKNDIKGLYKAKASAGPLIGVEDAYEPPRNPNLVIDTDGTSVEQATGQILNYLESLI